MYRALIVDDEPLMLEGMRLMVDWQRHGFAMPQEADSGRQALELIRCEKPDLVITDLNMPGLGGVELSELCRREFPDMLWPISAVIRISITPSPPFGWARSGICSAPYDRPDCRDSEGAAYLGRAASRRRKNCRGDRTADGLCKLSSFLAAVRGSFRRVSGSLSR